MKRKIDIALGGLSRIYFDSAPLIYYVERNPAFFDLMRSAVRIIQSGAKTAVIGPVTLAECLVSPFRQRNYGLAVRFFKATRSHNMQNWSEPLDATRAAKIRAVHNLRLPDAFQVATALAANCDAILTNDSAFKRITEIPVLVLSELEI